MTERSSWPDLQYSEWASTKKSLHMVSQMLGKVRIALSPPQPEWLHTCLYLNGRGFTTGAIPWNGQILSLSVDVFDPSVKIQLSDGRTAAVPLVPSLCVADIWNELQEALKGFGIGLDIWEKPQEVADTTYFSKNTHDCDFDATQAQRFYGLLATLDGVFERFRSGFFGRSGVQFWWGAFDFAVLLFNGYHAKVSDDVGYIMRYDLDAEHMNAGFWPGDDSSPDPFFYAYINPRPDGCETAPVAPKEAAWSASINEWILPYGAVRESNDPAGMILEFFNSVYAIAIKNAGWNAEVYRYTPPPPSGREA